jgi:hypothetical protein
LPVNQGQSLLGLGFYAKVGIMKDSYMIFVLLAVMITPFLPQLLKPKCPSCTKRKLETLENETATSQEEGKYITYFNCKACQGRFKREKSGPIEAL